MMLRRAAVAAAGLSPWQRPSDWLGPAQAASGRGAGVEGETWIPLDPRVPRCRRNRRLRGRHHGFEWRLSRPNLFGDSGAWSGGGATITVTWTAGQDDALVFSGTFTKTPIKEYKGSFNTGR